MKGIAGIACCVLVAAALLAMPAGAALSKEAGAGGVLPPPPEGAPVLLYSQTDFPSGNGAPDQDFEAAFNAYDCEGADDFVVTAANGWTVEQVVTVGTQSTGGVPASVDVAFYANSAGGGDPDLPGAVECSYPGLIPIGTASLTLNLPAPCILTMGPHWVGIQVNQNFGGGGGQHFWSNRTAQTGSEGTWRNPGNGFATGCTTFMPQTVCGVGGSVNPDFLFQILGQIGGLDADIAVTKIGAETVPGTVVYTITVTNNGPGTANNVVVTDTLPPELAYVSDDCGGVNTPPWTWNVGTLANAASAVCNITLDVVTAGTVVNTASATADETDPTPGNNSSTATLNVVGIPEGPPGIPTVSGLGLGILLALLALGGLVVLRRLRG